MTILDRYIVRRFTAVLIFSLVAFISIFIIVNFIEKLDDFLDQNVPKNLIAEYYLYQLPYIIVLTLPVAMLLSSLFSVGKMSRDNELTAIKAAGISLYRTLAPLFGIGLLVSLFALAFSEWVVPPASARVSYITDEYLEKHRQRWRKRINDVILQDDLGRRISMRYFDAANNIGQTVSIRRLQERTLIHRIDARTIKWEDGVWVLYEGFERTFEGEKETAIPFERRVLPGLTLTPEDFSRPLKKPEEMSYSELERFITEVRRNGGEAQRWLVDLHLKLAIPFANLIIVLFGAPLSSPKRRSGTAMGFGISLAICFIYFGITKSAQTMGQNGSLQPLLAAWIANIVFAFSAMVVMAKVPK